MFYSYSIKAEKNIKSVDGPVEIVLWTNNPQFARLFKSISLSFGEYDFIHNYLQKTWDYKLQSYSNKGIYINSSKFCLKKAYNPVVFGDITIVFDNYSKSLNIEKGGIVFNLPKADSDYLRKIRSDE